MQIKENPIPRIESFSTLDELYSIPWVKEFTLDKRFNCFILHRYDNDLSLVATYGDKGVWKSIASITPMHEGEKLPLKINDYTSGLILSDPKRDIFLEMLQSPLQSTYALTTVLKEYAFES